MGLEGGAENLVPPPGDALQLCWGARAGTATTGRQPAGAPNPGPACLPCWPQVCAPAPSLVFMRPESWEPWGGQGPAGWS